MCTSCAQGFYLRPDRTCAQCPEAAGTSTSAQRLKASLPFAAVLLGSFAIVATALFALARSTGEDDAKRAFEKVSLNATLAGSGIPFFDVERMCRRLDRLEAFASG